MTSSDVEISSWSDSESSVSSWSHSDDLQSDNPQMLLSPATSFEISSATLLGIVNQCCPCRKVDHYHPFRDASLSFGKLSKLRYELQYVMTRSERNVQLFSLAKKGNNIGDHEVCFKGFCALLGVSPKVLCKLRNSRFAPPIDERCLHGVKAPAGTPVADVAASFLSHAHAVYAEDMANVVGWGLHDLSNIPQAKWKYITDCVLCPESELQMSELCGPAAQVCRQDAKLLPPMSPSDLSFSGDSLFLTSLLMKSLPAGHVHILLF